MKVGILTFHDGINHGAYLQCLALTKVISGFGHEVEIINYKNFKHWFNEYKCFLKTKRPNLLLKNIIKITKFKKEQKLFPLSKFTFFRKRISQKYYNAIVVGSDIVWNFRNPLFGFDPIYFGYFLNTDKLISYAASFGAIKKEEIIPDYVKAGLSKFSKISVRDLNSLEIVRQLGRLDVNLVLDPTFLYDFTDHKINCDKSDFILIYTYLINTDQITQIKKFAMKKGLKIIAVAYNQPWCNENVIATSPFEWLGYFRKAKHVVTSTFHGTIFSIKYKKNFITIPNIKIDNKIKYILDMLDLNHRVWYKNVELEDVFNKRIKYDKVNYKLKEHIKNSLKFLRKALINESTNS
jgi:polysaccharide pyruvyl transferase WcaK-like protein